jgi:hypothetical protein
MLLIARKYKCQTIDCIYKDKIAWIPSDPELIPTCSACNTLCEPILDDNQLSENKYW